MNPVLHRAAQPISAAEFVDALRAAAPPRFPHARVAKHRKVALAVSGGVDSMALAFMCARTNRTFGYVKVGDFPVSGFYAIVVDHGLREGSDAEAQAVALQLTKMGHLGRVWPIRWKDALETARSTATGQTKGPSQAVLDALTELSIQAAAQDPPVSPLAAILATKASPPGLGSDFHKLLGSGALETLARRLRYRILARRAILSNCVSLLLAHHEDDQYETVLMRLLSGYGLYGGLRGLRGMRAASDIPECHGYFGAHQSGFIDDQLMNMPTIQLQPTRAERRRIKREFRADYWSALAALDEDAGAAAADDALAASPAGDAPPPWDTALGDAALGLHFSPPRSSSPAPPLAPLDTEDLGIVVYRPLLAFSKDRLVATCEANGVTWFEDHTNHDPKLTLRNALRHLVVHHRASLPPALQKPAILRLAERCNATALQHEAEARRWMARQKVIVRFTDNVGTLVVDLPPMRPAHPKPPPAKPQRGRGSPTRSASSRDQIQSTVTSGQRSTGRRLMRKSIRLARDRLWNSFDCFDQGPVLRVSTAFPRSRLTQGRLAVAARQKRLAHRRMIAALVVRNMLSFVTPEEKVTPVTQLQTVVDTLFPDLTEGKRRKQGSDRKAFSLCGVHFIPVHAKDRDGADTAGTTTHATTTPTTHTTNTASNKWYLVRAPYPTQDPRSTLPTIYYKPLPPMHRVGRPPEEWPFTSWRRWVLYDGRFWVRIKLRLPMRVRLEPFHADHAKSFRDSLLELCGSGRWDDRGRGLAAAGMTGHPSASLPSMTTAAFQATLKKHAPGKVRFTLPAIYVMGNIDWVLNDTEPPREPARDRETGHNNEINDPAQKRLVALPTLGVYLPGIEKWIEWEVRYRKVDMALLESSCEEGPLGWA